LRSVFMGVESGFDPALRALRKGLKTEQHLHAINVLKALEILPTIGFIMFRPDTTMEELSANLSFLEEIGCGEITAIATQLKVYGGTDLVHSLHNTGRLEGSYLNYQWQFSDHRVEGCYRIAMENADILALMYNEFSCVRRKGLLTYEEALRLQRVMNAGPITIMKDVIKEVADYRLVAQDLAPRMRTRFEQACEDFLTLLRFSEAVARKRNVEDGVQLLNPMSLC
jgi:radical SAM superfamily enzyme YgiQ (UPF0313 family)